MEFDALPDIEWCGAGIPNQFRGSCDTQQAKSEPVKFRVLHAAIVAFADGRKKFIGREGQTANGINLVDEEDESFLRMSEGDVAQGADKALDAADPFLF